MLDLVLMKQKRICIVKNVRAYRGPECGTHHYMMEEKVICFMQKRNKEGKNELGK
jgi:hypothetical protein